MAKIYLSDLKDIKLADLLSEIKHAAAKQASGVLGDGREQLKRSRRDLAGNDGDMLGGFILGLSVGALVGAALALLLTPVSGDQARRKLAERAEKLRGEGASEWETAGSPAGNGHTTYQSSAPTSPTYGTGSPIS